MIRTVKKILMVQEPRPLSGDFSLLGLRFFDDEVLSLLMEVGGRGVWI
jgi:hypothetical protein